MEKGKENKMEIRDLYTRDRQKTDLTIKRGDQRPSDLYHLIIHVCLFNSQGHLLIQKRHPQKEPWPGLWDISCGGASLATETSQQAAQRELYEELGIDHDFSSIRPAMTLNYQAGFDDIFIVEKDLELEDLKLQPEEVVDAKYASLDDIFDLIDQGKFIPYHKSLIQTYFDLWQYKGGFFRRE